MDREAKKKNQEKTEDEADLKALWYMDYIDGYFHQLKSHVKALKEIQPTKVIIIMWQDGRSLLNQLLC